MATYLHNILPNKKLALQSPTKILYQKDPSYSHLRVFGCLCYPLIQSTTRNKLQPRSTPCVFLGYSSNHRGYKCYELSTRKIILSRHVIFEENTFPFSTMNPPTTTDYNFLDDGIIPLLPSHLYTTYPATPSPNIIATQSPAAQQTPPPPTMNHTIVPLSPTSSSQQLTPTAQTPSPIQTTTSSPQTTPTTSSPPIPTPISPPAPHSPQMRTRSQHGIVKPRTLFNLHTSTHQTISHLPTNPIDALIDPNWKMAMKDEYYALIENKMWELVPRPSNANVIRSLWIFRHKKKSDGSFERYKARLVGNGANQHTSGLFLSQRKYAEEIIERAGMSSCKPSPTPVDTKAKLSGSSGNPYHDPTEYRSLAGTLQYLTFTRPDISYAVKKVRLFMHDPKTQQAYHSVYSWHY